VVDPALDRLAEALVADPAYARGERPFPGTVTEDDALALVAALHEGMDAAAAMRADGARRLGRPLACAPGCCACCEEPVMVFLPEALAIARWLDRPEQAGARAGFLAAHPAWRARAGDGIDALGERFAGDPGEYLRAYGEQWRRRALCAFNAGGLCSVYPVRPLVCRNAHAVETSAHCGCDQGSGKPTRLAVSEVDRYVQKARSCVRAAHRVLGGRPLVPAAICDAVKRLLERG
jgi:Fe-S-cluster containining protein